MTQGLPTDLHRWSLAELSAGYATLAFRPSEVADMYLSRIERIDGQLNSVVALNRSARDAASSSDLRWQSGRSRGPLDGVPYLVKDNLWTAGLVTTWGSRLFADFVPTADEDTVAALAAAGAVLLGKTNVPEFADLGATYNEVYGRTRNPWNTSLSPGGSSGGSAAAIAAGLGAFALGTDAGGSIRRPSAHCGLVGFKPTPGRVPRGGGFPVWLRHLDVIGPMTRSVADLNLVMDVITGPQPTLLGSVGHTRWSSPARDAGPRTVKIMTRMNDLPVDSRLIAGVRRAADLVAADGHEVVDAELWIDLAGLAELLQTQMRLGLGELASHHAGFAELVEPAHAETMRAGVAVPAASRSAMLAEVYTKYDAFRSDVVDLFGAADILMTPTTAAQTWDVMVDYPDVIDGRAAGPRGHAAFTAWVNAAGLPAISVPMGIDDHGLPMGLQLIGKPGADIALVAFAGAVEELLARHRIWNGIRLEL